MSFRATMDMAPLLAMMDRVLPYINKTRDEVLVEECRGLVKKLINLSPPGSQGESLAGSKDAFVKGMAAKRQGENAVMKDLMGGRRGHSGSRAAKRAGIFEVMDDALLARATQVGNNVRIFATKDGIVYGCDRRYFWPNASIEDMDSHHARYFKNGRMTTAGGMTRDIGRWVFIDKMVVSKSAWNRYIKFKKDRVGLYASSLIGAFSDLGGTGAPSWINRHRGKLGGGVSFSGTGDLLKITITADTPFATADMQRRMNITLGYTMANLPKRIQHITRGALKKAGLSSVALT